MNGQKELGPSQEFLDIREWFLIEQLSLVFDTLGSKIYNKRIQQIFKADHLTAA